MKTKYYKYRTLYQATATGREENLFTKSIFKKAEIFYATPKSCNDPFDCNLRLHVRDSTDQEWETYIMKRIAADPTGRPELERVLSQKLWKSNPAIAADVGGSTQKQLHEESSLFCLSKIGNSIPMFAYYADSHTGIAVEFEFDETEVPCGISFGDPTDRNTWYDRKIIFGDVKYPAGMPELNFHRLHNASADELVRSLMFSKAQEWTHEKEFRIFRRQVPAATVQFERPMLTRVILGCRATDTEQDLVRLWLAGWPTDVVIAKVEPMTEKFELAIRDIETIKGT